MTKKMIQTDEVTFIKELYPRLKEDDAIIERYRTSIDRLPPITVVKGRVLVDGYHRWQAHKREGITHIGIEDLGDLTDVEIMKESIRRNSSHGYQLATRDKKRMADVLYRQGCRDGNELLELLSISMSTLETYLRDAKKDEKEEQQAKAWDLWLDCHTEQEIGEKVGRPRQTITDWIAENRKNPIFGAPPDSRQHFDVWQFQTADKDAGSPSYFGAIPPQIVENILWLYTVQGNVVVDPFAGSGTVIDVAKKMGRRIWASDRKGNDYAPMLPIHKHDIMDGWPKDAPKKADLILLDPPYWMQAKGRYSKDAEDLGNMSLDEFISAWSKIVKLCKSHLSDKGKIAYIVSPAEDKGNDRVVDLAWEMYRPCLDAKLKPHRRIIATYNTQQATGQQVEWAREKKKLLKLYRDIVVLD
jgi:hypothetical protein